MHKFLCTCNIDCPHIMCMVTTMHAICEGLVAKLKYDFVKSKSIITFPDCSELPLKTEINQLKIKTEPVMHVENN